VIFSYKVLKMTEKKYEILISADIISSHPLIKVIPENKSRILQLLDLFSFREIKTVVMCEEHSKILEDIVDPKLRMRVEAFHTSLLNLYEIFASEASLKVREEKFKFSCENENSF
jgi:hypothetical protein